MDALEIKNKQYIPKSSKFIPRQEDAWIFCWNMTDLVGSLFFGKEHLELQDRKRCLLAALILKELKTPTLSSGSGGFESAAGLQLLLLNCYLLLKKISCILCSTGVL